MEKIKKTLFFIVLIMLIIIGTAFALPTPVKNDIKQGDNTMEKISDKKILIAYFSWSGNTRKIAQKIENKLDADIFELEAKIPYPDNSNETTTRGRQEIKDNIKPELKQTADISKYDTIFVGTPVWWYTMAPIVRTFLEGQDFTGKTIIPFITHGGGGEYTIAKEMEKYAKGSKVQKSISIYGGGNTDTDKEIETWLKELKYVE